MKMKTVYELNQDITNLKNAFEALEDKLIDLYEDKPQEEKEDLNHEIANILEDNEVYDLVRNMEAINND